jgi:hypothetical protein
MSTDNEISAIIHITERTPEERALFIYPMLKLHKDFNEKISQNPVEDPVFDVFHLKGKYIIDEIECWDEGDAGAKLSRDDLEFVDEEFFDNEFKQSFLEFLEKTYYAQDPENYEPPRDKSETKWESDCLCLKEPRETIQCTKK